MSAIQDLENSKAGLFGQVRELSRPSSRFRKLTVLGDTVAVPTFDPFWTPIPYESAKRMLDIVAVGAGLVVLSPLFAIIACMIKLTSKGPVFFKQKRVGLNGQVFDFYKFRSMRTDAEAKKAELLKLNHHSEQGITFKMKDDPRVTWVGKLLRRTSLDELPQLWNVLRGEMSLVGPRPAVISEVEKYGSRQRRRLEVTPGLTCIWQVSGRADLNFDKQVELDIEYINKRSLWYDLKLILMTVPAVISAKGAY